MKLILTLFFGAAAFNFLNAQTLDTGILGLITDPSGDDCAGRKTVIRRPLSGGMMTLTSLYSNPGCCTVTT